MSKRNHPIEQEELMAYLDGELATNRAVEAAAHLEHCAECQEFAAELRKISAEMMEWKVETAESGNEMPLAVKAALQDRPGKPRKIKRLHGWRALFSTRRLVWASGSVVVIALLVSIVSVSKLKPAPQIETFVGPEPSSQVQPRSAGKSTNGVEHYNYDARNDLEHLGNAQPNQGTSSGLVLKSATASLQHSEDEEDVTKSSLPATPMIARTVGLILTTKEFDKTRASLDEILKRHNGYFGEMNANAPDGGARTFTATLRIPAPQLDAALAELKQLGRVEKEAQGGEEVTQQYVDLEARLANAQHTEQRLTQILQQRTGKLQDVLKVELEIDRVRGEIEQMQAEKKELTKRVAFATLNMTVQEEYQARLQGAPPSTGSKFRNAAVDGYNTVVETFISIGLFLLSAGPSLLVWFAILFFPARFAWKKWKKEFSPRRHGDTEEK